MTRNHHSNRNLRSFVGTALIIAGSAVLVTYSAVIAWQFNAALSASAVDSVGFFGTLGLASFHAIRTLIFDPGVLVAGVYRLLILFSAFTLTLAGIALLPKRTRVPDSGQRSLSALSKGDQ